MDGIGIVIRIVVIIKRIFVFKVQKIREQLFFEMKLILIELKKKYFLGDVLNYIFFVLVYRFVYCVM